MDGADQKALYEEMSDLASKLPVDDRERFAILLIRLTGGRGGIRYELIRRWGREHGYWGP